MPVQLTGPYAQTKAETLTPAVAFDLAGANSTWSTANAAASLASASRADQLTVPAFNSTTGEHVYDREASMAMVQPILRLTAAHVLTFNVWLWWQGPFQIGNASVAPSDLLWHPWLLGRFTAQFTSAGTATNGVTGGAVIGTDIYCSNLAVVATYDRRGDYTKLWQILQPAVDDGSPAILLFDTLGCSKVSLEGRTTTNGDAFHFAVAGLSST